MQNENDFVFNSMEDISSKSENFSDTHGNPVTVYSKGIAKRLCKIVKAISFIMAFAIIAISFVAAFFIYSEKTLFAIIAVGIVILGTVMAAITMFLIYALGQILEQNNEILKMLSNRQ